MHILLIEDHLEMVQTLTQSLGVLGIQVESCTDGLLADAALQQHAFDAVVLDLALPRMHGIEILRRLRQRADKVPVLVLTASGDTYDRVQGLNAGADDYLAKPFDLSELEARLRALHRRCVGAVDSVLSVAALEFNTVSRRFALGTHHLDLPPREHDLLEALIVHASRPVSKLVLTQRLRTSDAVLSNDALEIYVHRLRRRLDGSGAAIHTLRGLGYVLEAADDAPA
ncbi:response regulator [Polaromonas sp. P1(28)-8]|nr:response regulator [Polaromonas sp. P1(28)-8]